MFSLILNDAKKSFKRCRSSFSWTKKMRKREEFVFPHLSWAINQVKHRTIAFWRGNHLVSKNWECVRVCVCVRVGVCLRKRGERERAREKERQSERGHFSDRWCVGISAWSRHRQNFLVRPKKSESGEKNSQKGNISLKAWEMTLLVTKQ